MPNLREATTFEGWRVAAASVWALFDGSANLFSFGSSGFLVLGLAGLSNVVFLLTPLTRKYRSSHRKASSWLVAISVAGVSLGLIVPHCFSYLSPTLLGGYFVWIAGYAFLIFSMVLSLTRPGHRKN